MKINSVNQRYGDAIIPHPIQVAGKVQLSSIKLDAVTAVLQLPVVCDVVKIRNRDLDLIFITREREFGHDGLIPPFAWSLMGWPSKERQEVQVPKRAIGGKCLVNLLGHDRQISRILVRRAIPTALIARRLSSGCAPLWWACAGIDHNGAHHSRADQTM